MKKSIAFILFLALPVSGMAVQEQTPGTQIGPPGAGPPRYESWPAGSPMSAKENTEEEHISAAASHEQAAAHHNAAATAIRDSKNAEAKTHAIEADKASAEACEKSKVALKATQSK